MAKKFNTMYGIGKSKYVVNTHDGVQTHKDGSEFFGIKIFKNKKKFEQCQKELKQQGYIER